MNIHVNTLSLSLVMLLIGACTPEPGGIDSDEGETRGEDESSGQDEVGEVGEVGEVEAGAGVCGDGVVGEGEICDDMNLVDGDGCNSQCGLSGVERWRIELPWDSYSTPRPLVVLDNHDIVVPIEVNQHLRFMRFSPQAQLLSTMDFLELPLDPIETREYVVRPDGGVVAYQDDEIYTTPRLIEVDPSGMLVRSAPLERSVLALAGEQWLGLSSDGSKGVITGSLDDLFSDLEPNVPLPDGDIIYGAVNLDGAWVLHGRRQGEGPAYWRLSPGGVIEDVLVEPRIGGEIEAFSDAVAAGGHLRLISTALYLPSAMWSPETQTWMEDVQYVSPVVADGGWVVQRSQGIDKLSGVNELLYSIADPDSRYPVADGLDLLAIGPYYDADLVRYAP